MGNKQSSDIEFDLFNNLDDVFNSVLQQVNPKIINDLVRKLTIFYKYGQKLYKSTISKKQVIYDGKIGNLLKIKIPYYGYLYYDAKNLLVYRDDIYKDNMAGFLALNRLEFKKLSSAASFIKQTLNIEDDCLTLLFSPHITYFEGMNKNTGDIISIRFVFGAPMTPFEDIFQKP
jgi:hypothetical protein